MIASLNSIFGEVSSRFFSFMVREIVFSAFLFILILILTRLLRNKSPLWHLGLWAFVLIRLVLPPGFTNPVAKYNGLNDVPIMSEVNDLFSESRTLESQNRTYSIQPGASNQNALVSGRETSTDNKSNSSQVLSWKIGVFGIWLFGFLVTLSIYLKKHLYYRRLIRNASHLQDEQCHAMLFHWRKAFKVKRHVKLVCSRQCLSPFTMRVLQPVIYLPQSLLEANDMELLNSVISHEVAHIKHCDALWIKFQNLIQSVYFFYPVVWYANSKIHLARECLRDTQVISQGKITPKIFGNGILSLLRMNLIGSADFLYLPRFGNEKKKVTYRLRNLKSKRASMVQKIFTYLFLVGLGVYIIPIFGSIQPTGTSVDSHDGDAVRQESTPRSDNLTKGWIGIPKDEDNPGSRSIKHPNNTLNLSVEQQKSLERDEQSIMESVEIIKTRTTPKEEPLPAFVEIPDDIFKERPKVIGLNKSEKKVNETSAEAEESEGTKRGDRSSLNKGAEVALDRSIESDLNSPVRLDGQYIPPKPIRKVKPEYPLIARQARVEGVVILEATTDEQGRVKHVEVLRSIPLLDQAAVEAVRQWVYEPMIINGKPRAVIFKVKVNFVILRNR
ncbi:MAG: M56 family metallopeptidase [Candidatus Aminicenantes bacterium]